MMAGSPDNGQYVQDHVLNIDEETRMYPDSTNDSDAFLSSETSQHALHSDGWTIIYIFIIFSLFSLQS